MKMKLFKALRELSVYPMRTFLVTAALFAGFWGAGMITISYSILGNDLNANFRGTSPAHFAMTSTEFDKLNMEEFLKKGEIESAEFRPLTLLRVEAHPGEWIPLWLFGVKDFERIRTARFRLESGERLPSPGTFLMERDGLLISDLRSGSVANVRSGSKNLQARVSGIVFDPGQAPATQDHFIYAYATPETYELLTGERFPSRLIVRLRNAATRSDSQKAAERIVQDLKIRGIQVDTLVVPEPDEHPHQWQLNTLLFLQGSIGLLAFIMGAFLVSQLMAAMIAGQTRQIGILKAIGARRIDIIQIYLIMILIPGAIAASIAIPLASAAGYAFAEFISRKLNFEILTTGLPPGLYLAMILVSLLLPLVFSFRALQRGSSISVRDALTDYGIRGESGAENPSSFVSTISPMFLAAFRNVLRRKKRFTLTVLMMSLGVAIFSTGFNIRQSLSDFLAEIRAGMRYDVQVVLSRQVSKEEAMTPFHSIPNVSRIEAWNGGRGELQSRVISTGTGIGIVALPWNTDLFRPRVTEGRWLNSSSAMEMVVNQQAMRSFPGLAVGQDRELETGGRRIRFRLVGIIEEFEKPKIYLDAQVYNNVANPQGRINSLMFTGARRDFAGVMELKKEIERALTGSNLSVLYVMSQAERAKVIFDHLDIIFFCLLFFAFLVLFVASLGMASSAGISTLERTREIGVMRAVGASNGAIFRLFTFEGAIVSSVSLAIGTALSLPLSIIASRSFGNLMLGEGYSLRFAFSLTGFLVTVATVFLSGWLASRIPAGQAMRIAVRDALAY